MTYAGAVLPGEERVWRERLEEDEASQQGIGAENLAPHPQPNDDDHQHDDHFALQTRPFAWQQWVLERERGASPRGGASARVHYLTPWYGLLALQSSAQCVHWAVRCLGIQNSAVYNTEQYIIAQYHIRLNLDVSVSNTEQQYNSSVYDTEPSQHQLFSEGEQ